MKRKFSMNYNIIVFSILIMTGFLVTPSNNVYSQIPESITIDDFKEKNV